MRMNNMKQLTKMFRKNFSDKAVKELQKVATAMDTGFSHAKTKNYRQDRDIRFAKPYSLGISGQTGNDVNYEYSEVSKVKKSYTQDYFRGKPLEINQGGFYNPSISVSRNPSSLGISETRKYVFEGGVTGDYDRGYAAYMRDHKPGFPKEGTDLNAGLLHESELDSKEKKLTNQHQDYKKREEF